MKWHALSLSLLLVLRDLFLNPLLYAGFALALWDLRRTSSFERKFFGIRRTRALVVTMFRGLQGLGVGLVISVFFVMSGLSVALWEIGVVTVLSILLAIVRLRFLSPTYAIALLATMAFVIAHWTFVLPGWAANGGAYLSTFHTLGWMVVLAGVLVAEAWLVGWRSRSAYAPVVLLSKRGRGIGALWAQLAFLVPLIVPITGKLWSAPEYAAGSLHAFWLSGVSAFAVASIPCLVGFSGVFHAMQPKRAIHQVVAVNIASAVVLIGGVVVSRVFDWAPLWWTVWIVVAAREGVLSWLQRSQNQRDPLFAPTEAGVTILSVLPHSLAETLGLQAGERIVEMNDIPVHSPYDVHFALNQNPAYARLRVLDNRREVRLVGHTVYEGERAQLGLIFAPDEISEQGLTRVRFGLFGSLYARLIATSGGWRTHSLIEAQTKTSRVNELAVSTNVAALSEVAVSNEDSR